MKKKTMVLICLLSSIMFLSAVRTGQDSFYIRAYKIGSNGTKYLTLNVFDALTGTLQTINSSYQTMDLTEYTNKLLNPVTSDSSYSVDRYSDHVIFSFRISGNAATNGNISCSISISPFTNDDTSEKITAYYEMRDLTCVFTSNYKTTTTEGGSTSVSIAGYRTVVESSDGDLGFSWSVNTGSRDLEDWRMQGSVGVSINNSSYKAASTGMYQATVTIGVTVS